MEEKTIIVENQDSTVVGFYQANPNARIFANEKELEEALIKQLTDGNLGYEKVHFSNCEELKANLRKQLEKLNNYQFSDEGWDNFLKTKLINNNTSVEDKTEMLQNGGAEKLWDDPTTKKQRNIKLIDKQDLIKNSLQVMEQFTNNGAVNNRYDVTILVNGLPMVGIELKRSGIDLKQAFNQIERYQRDSFSQCELFEYLQLFVISNGVLTKYFSNTTRQTIIENNNDLKLNKSQLKGSSSYSFAITWTDMKNHHIDNLMDFATYFLAKNKLLKILTRYCVFDTEKTLKVMRPYQITATEKILERIIGSHNLTKYGSNEAGGFIWHTTGSGKTLTSFKTATLIRGELPFIDKVLFVVDRKDLDYQTMKEYDKFQKGCVSSNRNVEMLADQLTSKDPKNKIIVTTIQKLSRLVNDKKHNLGDIANKEVVFVFDECHRSQFGKMHKDITNKFKKYYLFGFTGTPIFAENANKSLAKFGNKNAYTTKELFGDCLHQYTIVNAINDGTVLKFMVKYYKTIDGAHEVNDDVKKYNALDVKSIYDNLERIKLNAAKIDETFYDETMRYNHHQQGFNAMLACDSIDSAKKYYTELKKLQENKPANEQLKIGIIYSYAINPDDNLEEVDESAESITKLSLPDKDFLMDAIKDYNKQFKANYDAKDPDSFDQYYKDISRRMKETNPSDSLDLLIVVNMFLTGFDAPKLNTLFVDKNLKQHNLIQAFSRTNRILNETKPFGNIVCFRNLEKEVNDAIQLFGDENAQNIILMRTFDEYKNGYVDEKGIEHKGYNHYLNILQNEFKDPLHLETDDQKKQFIKNFNAYLKLKNILKHFSEGSDDKLHMFDLLANEATYLSAYNEYYRWFKQLDPTKKAAIGKDLIFEVDLVKQVDINVDYILNLIANNFHKFDNKDQFIDFVMRKVNSSLDLYSKKELIEMLLNSDKIKEFLDQFNNNKKLLTDHDKQEASELVLSEFNAKKLAKCKTDFKQLVSKEAFDPLKLLIYLQKSYNNQQLILDPTTINNLKPVDIFGDDKQISYTQEMENITNELTSFFDQYKDIINFNDLSVNELMQ